MKLRVARLATAIAALGVALVLAAACNSGGGDAIPAAYTASDQTYTVLHSTLGYDAAGTKRVLIRLNDPAAAISEGLAFEWRLIDASGRQTAAGRAAFGGVAWGIPLWAADFSAVEQPGSYRMRIDAPLVRLATPPFRIAHHVLTQTTLPAIALDNTEARAAPLALDGGLYDTNTTAGEAASHAELLVGLIEVHERRRTTLVEADRRRLDTAIDITLDYLVLLADPGSGYVRPRSFTRPFGRETNDETALVARALAHYAATMQDEEPDKTERAFRRARAILPNLAAEPPWVRATIAWDLYRYAGTPEFLDIATAATREQAVTYDLRTMDRPGRQTLPHFEAVYGMWRDLLSHPDRLLWQDMALAAATQYKEMLDRNAFQFVPSGVRQPDQQPGEASLTWDNIAAVPAGEGELGVVYHGWFLARAVDAVFLADMTKDVELERAAAAGIGWVAGLNAGIAPARALGADTGVLQAASLISGLPGSVRAWSEWQWLRPKPFASLVTGFAGGDALLYQDRFEQAETSIGLDGSWLYAITAYEDYLHPAQRAETPSPTADLYPRAGGIHVSKADASESGGVMQLVVRVVDAEGAAAEGVTVVVVWDIGLPPGLSPDERTIATSCVTSPEGSCVAVERRGSFAVGGPIMATVTNLDDAQRPYDAARNDPSSAAAFP